MRAASRSEQAWRREKPRHGSGQVLPVHSHRYLSRALDTPVGIRLEDASIKAKRSGQRAYRGVDTTTKKAICRVVKDEQGSIKNFEQPHILYTWFQLQISPDYPYHPGIYLKITPHISHIPQLISRLPLLG